MHDPDIVAFELCWPIKRQRLAEKYRPRTHILTIWHHDPSNYDTTTCAWHSPHLPKDADWIASLEGDIKFLTRENPNALQEQRDLEGAFVWRLLWLNRASFWHREKPLEIRHVQTLAFSGSFPGLRDNFLGPISKDRAAFWAAQFAARYLELLRPWYRHPRWHFWHWRLQIHHLQALKRWLFSRCAGCKDGFAWQESPHTYSWHGTGPLWFRSEPDMFHSRCMRSDQAVVPDTARKDD